MVGKVLFVRLHGRLVRRSLQTRAAHAVDAAVGAVEAGERLKGYVRRKAAAERLVDMAAVDRARVLTAHARKLRVPRAGGDVQLVVRRAADERALRRFDLVGHFQFAIAQKIGERERRSVADGALGHAAAALVRVILHGVDERRLGALAKGRLHAAEVARGDKGVGAFVEAHGWPSFVACCCSFRRRGRKILPAARLFSRERLWRLSRPGHGASCAGSKRSHHSRAPLKRMQSSSPAGGVSSSSAGNA